MLEKFLQHATENFEISFPNRDQLTACCQRSGILRSDQTIFVFCPTKDEELLKKILKANNVQFKINEYLAPQGAGNIFCHYKSWELHPEHKNFFVEAMKQGGWVEPLISFLDRNFGYTEVELLNDQYFLHQKAFSILSRKRHALIKRAFDLALSTTLLFITLPISIITALLIRLESKGPILFKQTRTGLHNKEFEVIKFRSMSQDAEKDGAKWSEKNDNRVTRVGKFIRKTRIDELPQLINVLKGEMSLIGPRPEREVFISNLEKTIAYYRFRHSVRPGISGLAQVKYKYGASIEDAIWKHKYDIYYIKHYNLVLDIKILFWTIKTVAIGMGR
ncbi:exopolysaccharide biosynthesis polyprenyl glycosylphosphotransferase [Halodesulfovibrio aestuarii]|uniref:exopolysaccharide biosynthesis polyprenyl glycosylphosphotransferase n=1 Tax=Halodesulfovibrio aestuarii TaxID=126333 RepID=UPI003D346B51